MKLSPENQIAISLAALCLGPILIILGACITLESLHYKRTWVPAPAQVTFAGYRSRNSIDLEPAFTYDFVVGGKRHRGSVIDHGILSAWSELGKRMAIRKFPQRTEITIYHDPKSPGRATLWNEVAIEGPIEVFLGLIMLVPAIICLEKLKRMKVLPQEELIDQTPDLEQREREKAIEQWMSRSKASAK